MNPTHSQSCLVSLFIGCNQSRPVIDHNQTLLGALRFTAALNSVQNGNFKQAFARRKEASRLARFRSVDTADAVQKRLRSPVLPSFHRRSNVSCVNIPAPIRKNGGTELRSRHS
jgi:hypothetical protein